MNRQYTIYGGHATVHGFENVELMEKIPKKDQSQYSEEFVDWLVNFWAHQNDLKKVFNLPNWLQKKVLLKIQEIDPKYDFTETLKTL